MDTSLIILLAAVALILVGVGRYAFKRAVKGQVERALEDRARSAGPASSPQVAAPDSSPSAPPSAQRAAYRQPLLRALGYDEAKVDRLIAFQRQRMPGANDEQLHVAAYERWLRDNR